MKLEKLKEVWKDEEQHSFKGWDFSYIDNRMKEEKLPWEYGQVVKSYMGEDKVLLDMGTGGGEYLISLDPTPDKTYATESYLPNIEHSRENLAPYGVEVRAVTGDDQLPFEDNFFDVIINRHESYCLSEVRRILKPGGVFITQQVGGKNNKEISNFLLGEYPNIIDFEFNLNKALQEIEKMNLKVIKQGEYLPKTYFYDIGALVYYAKIIEWEFPNFSVDRCFDELVELQEKLEDQGFIETLEHRFYLVAIKQL